MNGNGNIRSRWVWAALLLQGAAFLIVAWGFLGLLLAWPRYAQQSVLLPVIVRSTVEAAAAGISLVGLCRSKSWGWILAFLTDAAMCLLTLSNLIQYSNLMFRHPRWLVFSMWDFVAIAVLLHRPVRAYFLGKTDLSRRVTVQRTGYAVNASAYPGADTFLRGVEPGEINWLYRSLRVLLYFIAAVGVTCLVTSFSVTLLLGQKAGGGRGFLFLVLVGFMIGSGPSFVFALLLTLAARIFGPGRIVVWLVAGTLLAPCLTLGMGALASHMAASQQGAGILGAFFTGPLYLFQVWWLTIPAGLAAAFLCFQMFPWGFRQSR